MLSALFPEQHPPHHRFYCLCLHPQSGDVKGSMQSRLQRSQGLFGVGYITRCQSESIEELIVCDNGQTIECSAEYKNGRAVKGHNSSLQG